MNGFSILAAPEGGYIVQELGDRGAYMRLMFAGTLSECLAFIAKKFAPLQTAATDGGQ